MSGNIRRIGIPLITLCILLPGCQVPLGGNQNPANPVIKDRVKDSSPHIFSLIAARRMIFVNPDNETNKARVCTEPPPDASENVTSEIAVAMTLAATKTTAEKLSATANMSSALATLSKRLYKRAHGIQLYRDGAHYLCQRYLNAAFDDKKALNDAYDKLLDVSSSLILEEIKSMPLTPNGEPETPDALQTEEKSKAMVDEAIRRGHTE